MRRRPCRHPRAHVCGGDGAGGLHNRRALRYGLSYSMWPELLRSRWTGHLTLQPEARIQQLPSIERERVLVRTPLRRLGPTSLALCCLCALRYSELPKVQLTTKLTTTRPHRQQHCRRQSSYVRPESSWRGSGNPRAHLSTLPTLHADDREPPLTLPFRQLKHVLLLLLLLLCPGLPFLARLCCS
jgi:hypothetical protein